VKVYFALNAALHDAACAAWSLKRFYDSPRPVSLIRWMGMWGQSSDPAKPSYHPSGLPLASNVVELVTAATAGLGGRHQGFTAGQVVIYAWPGQPVNPGTQFSGVRWVSPLTWQPYQRTNFVTPAFPGFVSGHSTFSRAAAEVLTAITGTAFFPGGLGTYTCPATNFLAFERGPSQAVQLQWATYYDAADQAGLSRIWGGIHISADDLTGRLVGAECGSQAWALARKYFDGSIQQVPTTLTLTPVGNEARRLRAETLRGFHYQLQSTTNLSEPVWAVALADLVATNSSLTWTDAAPSAVKFYRAVRTP
jgi:hypothetical protein